MKESKACDSRHHYQIIPTIMHRAFVFLMSLLLLVACSDDPQVTALLDCVDSLTYEQPDSALCFLQQHEAEVSSWPSSQQMRHALLTARAQNKAFVDFTTDSVLLELTEYYDRHGTPNQQMEAHYLLGCVYRDLGEAPRAIECYLDAATRADTTLKECNLRTLGSTYAQMADMYHKQLLLNNEIEAWKHAYHYTFKSGDTLMAINYLKIQASPYLLQSKNDSAEIILKKAISKYHEGGYIQEALQASTMLMYLYIDNPNRMNDLNSLINEYESKCNLFDESHELPSNKRQYYYYKGKYYEGIDLLDSAELCYRKIYRPNMAYASKDPMYRGLLSVFRKKHQSDSIAKYATLFAEINDSSIAVKDRELTAQFAASYNYSHYQKEALDNAKTANQRLYMVVIFLSISLIVFIVAVFFWRLYKNKQKTLEQIEREYAEARNNYERIRLQMKGLDTKHKKIIEAVKKENAESQHIFTLLKTQHEAEKEQLAQELQSYTEKVEQLERQLKNTQYRKISVTFLSLGIVKRIKLYAKDCMQELSDNDLRTLTDAVKEHFPDLIVDLDSAPSITPLAKHVCLLTLLNLKPGEMVTLLGISSSQVSNLRRDINMALFNENTTRTLYQNLAKRYKILSS